MKRLDVIILAALTVSLLTSCGGTKEDSNSNPVSEAGVHTSDDSAGESAETKEEGLKLGMIGYLNISEDEYADSIKLPVEDENEEGKVPTLTDEFSEVVSKDFDIVYFDSLQSLLLAAESESIDGIIINRATADYLVSENPKFKINEVVDKQDESASEIEQKSIFDEVLLQIMDIVR